MAATKKGKKPSKPKSGSKPKKKSKKNTSGDVFTKMMLFLLLLAILCTAVFMILTNIKSEAKDKDDKTGITIEKKDVVDESREQESVIKKTEIKEETLAEKKEVKKEEVAPKKEVKAEAKKDTPIVKDEKPKTEPQPEIIDLKKEFKENHSISGCWLSSSQGASLTLDDYGYRIDFFGVDASQPMTGKYSAENNQIIFLTEDGDCKGIEGVYRISFDKKNISLTCKDDDCKKRKNLMEADWEWMEI